jgi:hypothetical protein
MAMVISLAESRSSDTVSASFSDEELAKESRSRVLALLEEVFVDACLHNKSALLRDAMPKQERRARESSLTCSLDGFACSSWFLIDFDWYVRRNMVMSCYGRKVAAMWMLGNDVV